MKQIYKNLEIICDDLGTLYEDGISLHQAIKLLQEVEIDKKYKSSLIDIEECLLKGDTLKDAFSKYPKLYPELFIGLIEIGERNGKLSRVLKSLSKYYKKRRNISGKVINALVYPIFLLIVLFIISLGVILFLIPLIYETMLQVNTNMSGIIEILYSFGNNIKEAPIIALLYFLNYFIVIPVLIFFIVRQKINIYKIKMKFEIMRKYYENLIILIFTIIFESSINLSDGIESCSTYCGEIAISRELKRVSKELLLGNELSTILENSEIISKKSLAMIRLGEKGGSMDIVFGKLEERIDEDFTKRIDRLVSRVQPTIIIIMAIFVVIFIFIFILPIMNMMRL